MDLSFSEQVSRVMKVGGHFLSVTFSQPHFRGRLLNQSHEFCWSVDHVKLGTTFHYFLYITTRRRTIEEVAMTQKKDYRFTTLYSNQTVPVSCLDYDQDNDFLYNIGDVYEVEMTFFSEFLGQEKIHYNYIIIIIYRLHLLLK